MGALPAKLAGPVKVSAPDPDTLILDCDRSFRWPVVFALVGAFSLGIGFWIPELVSLYVGASSLIASVCFALGRHRVILSAKTASLERRPQYSLLRIHRSGLRLDFADIREFLLEAEFEIAPDKPFVWHLIAIRNDGARVPLTWHFFRQPVLSAGQQAARFSKKSLREESDPTNSPRWARWGYNFLR